MQEPAAHRLVAAGSARLPVVGEVPGAVWRAVRGGQPVVLTRAGCPVVVVVDLGSWAEIEALLGEQ